MHENSLRDKLAHSYLQSQRVKVMVKETSGQINLQMLYIYISQ